MIKGPGEVGFVMELPADEQEIRPQDSPRASLWETELWNSFRSLSAMKRSSFYFGAFGHRALRPTTLASNYPALMQLDGLYDYGNDCVPPSLLTKEELNKWPKAFSKAVVDSILDYHRGTFEEEKDMVEAGVKVGKLTKEQREAWHVHLLNDHQPYRADCSVCINAQATGYKHVRKKNPSLYTMALDLAGPFKQVGRDMDHEDYKYILVAAYRCPKSYLTEKALKDLDTEMYVPDEPEDAVDDVMEVEGDEKGEMDDDGVGSGGEEGEPLGPETLDEAVEQLEKPEEIVTVYLTRSLRRRTSSHVLSATKEIYLQLKQCGLYVAQLHSDRAREFKAKVFKEWVVDNAIRQAKTAGGDPTGNSTAELGIKWAKSRVRALIKACDAPAKDWPMAISHASSTLWSKAFPDSPWVSRPAAPFGSEIWFRSKMYQGKAEKRHDVAGTRWKRGWYRGPAQDVTKGHLIVREDGGLTVAKSVKFNITDPTKELKDLVSPAIAEGLPEELLAAEDPPTKKELHREIEFRARKLKEDGDYSLEKVVELYRLLECLGDTDRRVPKKSSVTSWYTGAFVHGGVAGLRSNMTEFPHTSRYLVEVAKHHCGPIEFSAIGISKNAQLGIHRDSHNHPSTKNFVLPLGDPAGGSLWVQDEDSDIPGLEEKILPTGKKAYGHTVDMKKGKMISFFPKVWHEVQPWEGERLVLLMFTPRATKLGEEQVNELNEVGFNVDMAALKLDQEQVLLEEDEKDVVELKMFEVNQETPPVLAFIEVDERDWTRPSESVEDTDLKNYETVSLKKIIKKAEVQYTQNVEEILRNCELQGRQLDVTHTVSLGDVKRNLEKWKPSALKEFTNLTEAKRAFTVKKRNELPPGCRVVPCKGVYTAKPGKGPQGYRRKTRFVACGNHISETDANFDLFAAGLDATSLRTMLAYNAKRGWSLGTTDIRQAFVLAKWRGQPVALEPPGIAYELGIAQPGDMWFVEQAIYGLRESPALWSQHRDEELRSARWDSIVDGEKVTLKLEQMVTDNQIWKVVRENNPTEPLGYLLVYIDDLLIQAPENIMQTFFGWVASKWECDALDVLDYNHPIRFLGMELHRVQGGVEIAQEGFISELLRAYKHDGSRSKSQGAKETLLLSVEEEEAIISGEVPHLAGQEDLIKLAQKKVGEMLWLSGRTRPDIQYVTAIMSSRATRNPEIVVKIGERLLDYLCETKHYRLAYVADEEEPELRVYTDSSFAPSAGRSHGAAAVFYGSSPISWRSSRQPLMTMSTAETELLEAIEGSILGMASKGLLEELMGKFIPLYLHVDNMAACALLTTSTGSWRTRHLKMRSNWLKEKVNSSEVRVRHEPGETQRADIGTKPFTRERLRQLVAMWSLVDRRLHEEVRQRRVQVDPTWLQRLLLLCQVCGTAASKPDIEREIPWDLYGIVLVLAVAVIGIWEFLKGCVHRREVRLKALRARAEKAANTKLSKAELKELQRLLSLDPGDLNNAQKVRLVELREKFRDTVPPGTSPTPTLPEPIYPDTVLGEPASSSTSSSRNKQPRRQEVPRANTREQGVQVNIEPVFQRVQPPPPIQREVVAGPFYQVPGRDHLHVFRECWGLRNAGRVQCVTLCRCCAENGGHRIY